MRRILNRRLDKWLRQSDSPDPAVASSVRQTIDAILVRLADAGLVSDADFAEMRARTLSQGGQSNRAIRAKLLAKGVSCELAGRVARFDPDTELAAALVAARRRRLGPYRTKPLADQASKMKELLRLTRAGFSPETVQRVLTMAVDEAEERIRKFRL